MRKRHPKSDIPQHRSAADAKRAQPCHTNVTETFRKIDSGPSVHGPGAKEPRQVPVDLIEEEGMESFPASDPPGHLRSHTDENAEPRRPTDSDV